MPTISGQLLWNRIQVLISTVGGGGFNATVNTGLRQVIAPANVGDPPMDGTAAGSRVQVIPLAPLDQWAGVTHGEPVVDPTTGNIFVTFHAATEAPARINVLFWDPHSGIGPGNADFYLPFR